MPVNRRQFLKTIGAAAGAAPFAYGQRKRPNFVVLLTDDQRFSTIHALGNAEIRTPNMDRLVRRGVAFTHACTQGGLTGAICMPSRAQLMTGRSVFRVHRAIIDHQNKPDPSFVTFPELLRREGYSTFATGKWHNGPVLFNRSFSHGSKIFFGGMFDHLKTPVFEYDASGKYPKENAQVTGKFSSEMFADAAIGFLKDRDKSKPFLVYTAFTSPHDPRMAPQKFADLYPPGDVVLPKNFLPEHPFPNGELKVRDEMLAPFPRTPEEIRKHIAAYYGMISEVDYNIGRVLDAIEQTGDPENTYLIWAADNGLAVGQHGLLGKQNLYDHSLRVPMVISGPGIPKGVRVDSLCHLMDLCPTILDLAGVALPPELDARSLKGALHSRNSRLRDDVLGAYRNVQRSLRTDRYKLILYNVSGTKTTQLFDLQQDPWEMKNLANDPAHAKRIGEMKTLLQQRLKEAGDTTDLDAATWAS